MAAEETTGAVSPYYHFENLARSLMEVDLVHLDSRLAPASMVNRELMPRAVVASYDELFFGGSLLGFEVGQLVAVTERFHTCFAVLRLWDGAGWLLLGPYLPERTDGGSLEAILLENGLPLELQAEYESFYRKLPTLGQDKIGIFFSCMCHAVTGHLADVASLAEVDMTKEPAPCPVFEEDKLQAYAGMIEKRYAGERFMLQCIARGDYAAVEPMVASVPSLIRVPNRLRNDKNLLITFNTLLRKAIEGAQVHPLYIDRLSTRFAVRIEQLGANDSVIALRREMVREYCEEVRRHSLARYSPNVRRAIEYIQFNLTSPLSLKGIAAQLKTNPSYLSSQFNREVGQNLPDYITSRRIDESCRLMSSTAASIGQLATAVGFSDINYFSRVFKKKMGTTPSQYRRMLESGGLGGEIEQ